MALTQCANLIEWTISVVKSHLKCVGIEVPWSGGVFFSCWMIRDIIGVLQASEHIFDLLRPHVATCHFDHERWHCSIDCVGCNILKMVFVVYFIEYCTSKMINVWERKKSTNVPVSSAPWTVSSGFSNYRFKQVRLTRGEEREGRKVNKEHTLFEQGGGSQHPPPPTSPSDSHIPNDLHSSSLSAGKSTWVFLCHFSVLDDLSRVSTFVD